MSVLFFSCSCSCSSHFSCSLPPLAILSIPRYPYFDPHPTLPTPDSPSLPSQIFIPNLEYAVPNPHCRLPTPMLFPTPNCHMSSPFLFPTPTLGPSPQPSAPNPQSPASTPLRTPLISLMNHPTPILLFPDPTSLGTSTLHFSISASVPYHAIPFRPFQYRTISLPSHSQPVQSIPPPPNTIHRLDPDVDLRGEWDRSFGDG
jgi:hypothetical protein